MPDDNGGNTGTSTAAGGTSTTGSNTATGDGGGGQQQQQTAYTPPATQAELDRIIGDRIARERGKFGDYDDLKRKAAEFDQLTEAQKSEAQKAVDRATAAEAKATAAAAELARYKVAAEKNVPAELLAGKTEDELRAHADQLIAFRGGQQTTRTPSYDGGTRTTADGGKTDMNALIRRAAGVTPRS